MAFVHFFPIIALIHFICCRYSLSRGILIFFHLCVVVAENHFSKKPFPLFFSFRQKPHQQMRFKSSKCRRQCRHKSRQQVRHHLEFSAVFAAQIIETIDREVIAAISNEKSNTSLQGGKCSSCFTKISDTRISACIEFN